MGHKNSLLAKRVKVTPFGIVSVLLQCSSSYGAFTLNPLDVGVGVLTSSISSWKRTEFFFFILTSYFLTDKDL